ncbi:hypothetical protein [Cellulomonas sp. PhB150]|uniref:hypothetical protein n=1 Tax=Cellulomonas sp. PhB150 TaxID=2485188 RepID=UPI000F47F679|nr:hypothetical protein [Cellulomonas sp. PhB150]
MLLRLISWAGVSAVMMLVGTIIQARASLRELGERDPLVRSATFTSDLRADIPWWRPRKRAAHQKLVRELLRESPDESAAYRRTLSAIRGWSILATAALVALVGIVIGE